MWIHLETGRMTLRRFTADDGDDLFALHADPEVMRFINGGRPAPREEIENEVLPGMLRHYELGDVFGYWAAVERPAGAFLGWFNLLPPDGGAPGDAELGYRLRRSAWGKGYATEGARALIRKAFTDPGVERIVARTMTVNTASRRVMEKAGLSYLRTFHQEWPEVIEGGELGDVEYALARGEWPGRVRGRPGGGAGRS